MSEIITAGESSLTDCPSLLANTGYQVDAGGSAQLCVPLADFDSGIPEDYAVAFADIFCMQERVMGTVEVGSGECGLLITVPDEIMDRPGIYSVQLALLDDERPTHIRSLLLSVEPSLWTIGTDQQSTIGMVTVDQIRTQLRDTQGGTIIEGYEYSTKEIIHSLRMPIDFWNSTPPPGFAHFNGRTFPYTYHWIQATCANLMRISATWYLRQTKKMVYSGGVTVDDREKAGQYLDIAEALWNNYVAFVRETRLSLVRNNGAVALGSALPPARFGNT